MIPISAPSSPAPAQTVRPDGFLLSVAVALVISAAMSWSLVQDVWTTGHFGDTDDATRMVQIRDWMAGQAWYDLQMKRLGLPGAPEMHWTRIVDVPVALLVRIFGLALEGDMAERAARIAFPFVVLTGVYVTGALITLDLLGRSSLLPASMLLSLAGLSLLQFQPGRIDHHAPQALLVLLATLFLLRSVNGARAARSAFLCAGCIALSLSVSLENLPFSCAIGVAFVGLWVIQGKERRNALLGFGAGLVIVAPSTYALTVPPARWFAVACDAQSFAYVALALCGGAICIVLAAAGKGLASADRRAVATAAAAIPPLALAAFAFPQCLGDPYVGIDPLVRREWLSKVSEAQGIATTWSNGLKHVVITSFAPALVGLAGTAVAIVRAAGDQRVKWALVLIVGSSTFAVASLRIGYVQTMLAVTCFGAAYLLSFFPSKLRDLRIPGAFCLSAVAMALAMPAHDADAARKKSGASCARPDGAKGLQRLEPGLLLAPIDEGAYLLANTQHRIVAAPYHRNNEGNRIEALAFSMEPAQALDLLRTNRVDYVAVCGNDRRSSPLVSALLAGGGALPGVSKLDLPGAYEVWRLAP